MIKSRLLTEETLSLPMISTVSFLKQCRIEAGEGLIDLSVGNPDLPPCNPAIQELVERSANPYIHGYGNFDGQPVLKQSIINYYKTKYDVNVDKDEINILRGIRNILFYIAYLFAGPGDYVLIPSIGYQSYYLATIFSGATPYFIKMEESTGYYPDLENVPDEVLSKAKLLYLNYPNNPTGSHVTKEQLQKTVDIARKHNILICYDNAYNEIVFDGLEPISFMEIEGAKDIGIEVFSLSKLTGLAGWRIAFCISNKEIANYIWNYRAVTDSAPYDGFQFAAAKAIDYVTHNNEGKKMAAIYQHRRDIITSSLDSIGISYFKSQGGFYLWLNAPNGNGKAFAYDVVRKTKVLLTPGEYYGDDGAGNVRISLTAGEETLAEAAERLSKLYL